MKTIKAILSCFVLAVLFASCYEDKGNYNYKDLDVIQVAFPGNVGTDENVRFSQVMDGPLSIHPEITYGSPEHLTYAWERYLETNSTDVQILTKAKDLDITLDSDEEAGVSWKTGKYLLRFSVTDTITKQNVTKMINLVVRATTPVGIYILESNGTTTDMSTIENSDFVEGLDNTIVTPNYLSSKTGKTLNGVGRSIWWYNNGITLFTDKDGAYISTTNFTITRSWEKGLFADNKQPADPIRKMVVYPMFWQALLYTENEIYATGIDEMEDLEYNKGFELNTQKAARYLPSYFFSDGGSVDYFNIGDMHYDTEESAFVIHDWYTSYGDILPCGEDPHSPLFNPSSQADKDLIGMDYGVEYGYGGTQTQWALMRKKTDGSITAFRFNDYAYNDDKTVYDVATTIASEKNNPEMMDVSCFQMSPKTDGIAYLATPNTVYSLDIVNGMDNGPSELYTANGDEKITMIKLLKYNNLSDAKDLYPAFYSRLGLSLYIVTWDGTQGRIHWLDVDEEGNLVKEVETWEGFKEIKDICFRLQ